MKQRRWIILPTPCLSATNDDTTKASAAARIDIGGRNSRVAAVTSSSPIPRPDSHPAWSPDAAQIAFLPREGAASSLHLISALGGPERKIADLQSPPTQLSWMPDGSHIVLDSFVEGSLPSRLAEDRNES